MGHMKLSEIAIYFPQLSYSSTCVSHDQNLSGNVWGCLAGCLGDVWGILTIRSIYFLKVMTKTIVGVSGGVWGIYEGCLDDVWRMSGVVWGMFRRCLGNVFRVSGDVLGIY